MTLSPEIFDGVEILLLTVIAYLVVTSAESAKEVVKTAILYVIALAIIHFLIRQPWLNAAVLATPAIILAILDTRAEKWYAENYPEDKEP
jgi:hypothetical protein